MACIIRFGLICSGSSAFWLPPVVPFSAASCSRPHSTICSGRTWAWRQEKTWLRDGRHQSCRPDVCEMHRCLPLLPLCSILTYDEIRLLSGCASSVNSAYESSQVDVYLHLETVLIRRPLQRIWPREAHGFFTVKAVQS